MNGLKGYSDFFASGLATVGKEFIARRPRQRTRPTSFCSTISSTTTDSGYSASFIVLPYEDQLEESIPVTPTKHRPAPMDLSSASPRPRPRSREGRAKSTFSQLSSRLWDTLALFPMVDPLATPTTPKSKQRRFTSFTDFMRSPDEKEGAQDIWIDDSDSCPDTPVSRILPKHKRMSTFDPFGSLPDSKSFFVDFPDTPSPRKPPSQPQQQRTSFLSMPPTASSPTTPTRPIARSPTGSTFASKGTSSANSFVQLSRKDPSRTHHRKRSAQAASHSRQSSFQSHTSQVADQGNYCAPEDEEPLQGHFCERRDPAATIDWRQFHSDLMEVEA